MKLNDVCSTMRTLSEMLAEAANDLEAVVRLFGGTVDGAPVVAPKPAPQPAPPKITPDAEVKQASPFVPNAKLTKTQKDQIRLLWKQTPESQRNAQRKRELAELYKTSPQAITGMVSELSGGALLLLQNKGLKP